MLFTESNFHIEHPFCVRYGAKRFSFWMGPRDGFKIAFFRYFCLTIALYYLSQSAGLTHTTNLLWDLACQLRSIGMA